MGRMPLRRIRQRRMMRVVEIEFDPAKDALTDEDIARQVAENPDAAPIGTAAQFRAMRVRSIRRRSGLTQEAFAERYRIPVGTLRDWEQERREPDAAALAYLRVIEREPEAVARALAPPEAA
jgi:putative transcriptional regulator